MVIIDKNYNKKIDYNELRGHFLRMEELKPAHPTNEHTNSIVLIWG